MKALLRGIAMVLAAAFGVNLAAAYPDRPIRLIVAFPPGGSADVIARAMGPTLTASLGQPIIVENRPGAGGNIGVDAVAKAAPDGYTIGIGAAGALAVNVSLQDKPPFDPQKDLTPITMLAEIPFLLIGAPSFSGQSLRDVVTMAKAAAPGLSIGHGGNGTAMHLTAQLFNHMADVNISLVPYRGSAPVATDVLAGHIPLGVVDIPSALQLIKGAQLKALAVSTAKRVSFLPDVPTFDEAGVKGYESIGWFGIIAPAGTPPEVIAKLNQAFVAAMKSPELHDRMQNAGAESSPSTPEAFRDFIKSETDKWAKVIAISGAKAK